MKAQLDHVWKTLILMASALVLSVGPAIAQTVKLPIPGEPVNPTSREQCQAMSQEWSEIAQAINRQHGDCLNTQACKSSSGSDTDGQCSCRACLRLHLIMVRYNSGDLYQLRKQRTDECNRKVAAHEATQRQQRQAALEDQRARQKVADQAAQQYADAQRQYNEMLRQQREQRSAATAKQLENQRLQMERLRERQQQSQTALASMLSSSSGSSKASGMDPLPERPNTIIGTTLYDASKLVNLAATAKDDISAAMSAFTVAFSTDPLSRREASSNLKSYFESKAVDNAAESTAAAIVGMMPRRNDHHDQGFAEFFEAAQTVTTGSAPSSAGIQYIQRTAGGVLHDMFQQTLGDMAQLEKDINSFNAGSVSLYSSGRPPASGGTAGGNRSSADGAGSAAGSGSDTAPKTNSGAAPKANTEEPDLAREEVESLRLGLRYAMVETQVFSPSLARIAGFDSRNTPNRSAACSDQGTSVAEGKRICRDGRAFQCRRGKFSAAGNC